MAEETSVSMDAVATGIVAAMAVMLDALVTVQPAMAAQVAVGLRAKRAELLANPDYAAAAPVLDMLLHGLEQSARALQRSEPQGRA